MPATEKDLSQASDILAVVEHGDLNADLSAEIGKVLSALQDLCPPKGKVTGTVSVTMRLTVEGNTVSIEPSIDSKVPKKPRGSSMYFIKDGKLSVEHPQQESLRFGIREVA